MKIYKSKMSEDNKKRINRVIKQANVTRILRDLNIRYDEKKYKDYWFSCVIPSHRDKDPSAHILSNPNSTHCGIWHCFGCKTSGSIIDLVKITKNLKFWEALIWIEERLLDSEVQSIRNQIIQKTIRLPKNYLSPEKINNWNKTYLQYLFNRGVTWKQIIDHNIGYCKEGKYKHRVVIPIMLFGELRSWIAVDITGASKIRVWICPTALGSRPGLFGSEYASPRRGAAILVEGWSDALRLERLGYKNVMAICTNRISMDQFNYLQYFDNIIVMPDNDEGGNRFVNSLSTYVRDKNIYIAKLDKSKDPDDATDKEIINSLNAKSNWKYVCENREVIIEY